MLIPGKIIAVPDMKFIKRLILPFYNGQKFTPRFTYPGSLTPKHQQRIG